MSLVNVDNLTFTAAMATKRKERMILFIFEQLEESNEAKRAKKPSKHNDDSFSIDEFI